MPAAFRARIANIAAGDEERYLFFSDRVLISLNGREPVVIPGISQTVLATFIGAHPPTEVLKRALLVSCPRNNLY
jgi:hypothetical protein